MRRHIRAWAATLLLVLGGLVAASAPANADEHSSSKLRQFKLKVHKDAVVLSGIAVDASGNSVPYTVHSEPVPGDKNSRYEVITPQTSYPGDTIVCSGVSSPVPTYSWSNNTMFWGHKITCSSVGTLRMRSALFKGSTSDNVTTWQDSTDWVYGVGTYHSENLSDVCLIPEAYAYWKMFGYHEIALNGSWLQFTPYPGTHSPRWQECASIF